MASATSVTSGLRCGECGAVVRAGATHCWVCGRSAALAHLPGQPARWTKRDGFRFQLHSLFLTIALLSFVLGLARHSPYLAMALVVPLATAYLRTLQISLDWSVSQRPLNARAKIRCYLGSLAISLLILSGTTAALIVSIGVGAGLGMLAGYWRDEPMLAVIGFAAGTTLGVFAALAMGLWTGARLWPDQSATRRYDSAPAPGEHSPEHEPQGLVG